MRQLQICRFFFISTLVFLSTFQNAYGCSGYKITYGNKTFFGSNEDAWRTTPHIWFETKGEKNKYGAAFTGSRHDGENGYAPQSGMNEMGLGFERLASYHPKSEKTSNKKVITNPTKYLKDILHSCATVEEVRDYIDKFDYSYFIEDVFLYVDKTGKYLIVEPYSLTLGNEPTFVISNFCPSITSKQQALKLDRYRKGVEFLKNEVDSTLDYCISLSERMHVCRDKIGDGTLLTSIWDLQNETVNLFFYHQYKNTIQFNLKQELEKGNHSLAIETLFPPNREFELLREYKHPKNSILIGFSIVSFAGLFLFSSIFFLILFFRRKPNTKVAFIQFALFPFNLMLFYYMFVLSGSINVFYFSAPYKDPLNPFVSLSSYIPFVLLLLIIPLIRLNYVLFKGKYWTLYARLLFTLNNLVYFILIALFFYWGFYSIVD